MNNKLHLPLYLAGWLWVCLGFYPTMVAGAVETAAGDPLIRLHTDLPDTLSAAQAAHYNLFDDVQHLQRVWFTRALWGGVVAHLELTPEAGPRLLQRSLAAETWIRLQTQILAVEAAEDSTAWSGKSDPDEPTPWLAWPEVPVPQTQRRQTQPDTNLAPDYPLLAGRWLIQLGVGYQHNISRYRTFFTDQGMFNVSFAKPLSEHVLPYFSLDMGFGDLQDDFEDMVGSGRGNTFGLSLGILGRANLGRRTSVYAGGSFGYFIRGMSWGEAVDDQGAQTSAYARDLRDPGFLLRAGLLIQRGHDRKARFMDVGLGLLTCPADDLHYYSGDQHFSASGRDMWLMLTIRFWDTI